MAPDGPWMDPGCTPDGPRTDPRRTLDGPRTGPGRVPNGPRNITFSLILAPGHSLLRPKETLSLEPERDSQEGSKQCVFQEFLPRTRESLIYWTVEVLFIGLARYTESYLSDSTVT